MSHIWEPFLDRTTALRIVHTDRSLQINSTLYEKAPRLLMSGIAVEMLINASILAFAPIFCRIVWKSGVVHRNFRLQLCTSALYYSLGAIGRVFTFYAQYSGLSDEEVLDFFLPALFLRVAGNIFAESLILCFAFERTIATIRWSWYEKGSDSTLIIWLSVEALNVSMFVLNTYLKYWVSLKAMFIHNLLIAVAGFAWFWAIYRKNLRVSERIKTGAQVGSYSVSKTFQVKENMDVLRYMSWMGRGWAVASISTSVFYGYFSAGPAGFEVSRALAYNLHEMCISGHSIAFYCLSITGNKHILKQFRELKAMIAVARALRVKESTHIQPAPKIKLRSETDYYFTHYSDTWR